MLTLFLLFLSMQASMAQDMYISVSNGDQEGDWGSPQLCPEKTIATGYKLKVEKDKLSVDKTGLNAINLLCTKPPSEDVVGVVSSSEGDFGSTGPEYKCNSGSYLKSYQLKVGKYLLDEMGANNIMFKCSDGTNLEGDGTEYGQYGGWSDECPNGIIGIQTKVQPYRGKWKDDKMLTDARMRCKNDNE